MALQGAADSKERILPMLLLVDESASSSMLTLPGQQSKNVMSSDCYRPTEGLSFRKEFNKVSAWCCLESIPDSVVCC